MITQEVKRKLTAILSADVEGYSRLMGEDEVGTIRTLTAYRDAMTDLILLHSGRVVDSPGDNLLAEFASVVDAVQCAVEIQRELAEQNAELPEKRRMQYRIGVNLGDVVEEEDRIYGDGVNIAARMESLAEGGGICISGTVYDHVKNKVKLEYEHIGEQTVKNIAEPIVVYRVLSFPGAAAHRVIKAKKAMGTKMRTAAFAISAVLVLGVAVFAIRNLYLDPAPFIEPASVEKMAFPLPDKPSIAVLPFTNLSDDPAQAFLSDGITENIITSLSRVPNLFVIARNSTFTYKGKPVKVQQVAEELGVRYVLEGSMQRSGDRVRINVQLIDALAGSHLWAQRYDREINDVFALQDEISLKVAQALDVELVWGQGAEHYRSSVHNLEAYLTLMRARAIHYRHTKEDNFQSIQLYKKAIELDPEWIHPKIMLGYAYWVDGRQGWNYPRQESFRRAGELAQEALAADPSNSLAYNLLGALHLFPKREYEKAIELGEKAVALDPNNANAKALLAFTLVFAGRPQEAIVLFKKAMRLTPYYPPWYAWVLGYAYHLSGENKKAVEVTEKVRNQNPDSPFPHLILARVYADMNRMEEAQTATAEVLRINPKFTVSKWAKSQTFRDPAVHERQAELMRKAGLPEHPPLQLPDKPSIAVLPFINMSDDPKQEYFSDGITENIISSLAKVHNLFVIARNSTFTYKGKAVKIQQVAEELGVRYVLEGSVQKTADRVRITAQLIDAIKGNHLWAERYDSDLTDIFALQDEITKKIITSLQVKLTSGEDARLYAQTTDNLEAYLKFLEGNSHQMRLNKDANILARQKFIEAIALDADYIFALVNLAWTHSFDAAFGWSDSRTKSLETAEELAQKALSLDDSFGGTYGVLGSVQLQKGNLKQSVALRKKAIALEPNSANYHGLLGIAFLFIGNRTEEAIKELKIANRLDPFPPNWILHFLGEAYRVNGEYMKAIAVLKKAIKIDPSYWLSHLSLSACYGLLGREEEARAAAAEVLRIDPNVSIAKVMTPYKNKADKERTIEVLQKAGLK